MIMIWPKTRGLNVEVLLRQSFNNETLGKKGSLRCRNPRPQCFLLLFQLIDKNKIARLEEQRQSVAMAKLYLTSTNQMAPNLSRDTRQGPQHVLVTQGLIQKNIITNASKQYYNHSIKKCCRNSLTLTKNSCSQTLVVNLPPREMPKMPRKCLLQQVRLKISAKTLEEGANFRPHQVVSERL